MKQGTPRKLNSGEWGAAVQKMPGDEAIITGQEIKIVARSGKEWVSIIREVVYETDEFALVATRRGDSALSPPPKRRKLRCGVCGHEIWADDGRIVDRPTETITVPRHNPPPRGNLPF